MRDLTPQEGRAAVSVAARLQRDLDDTRLELSRVAIELGGWLEVPEIPARAAHEMGQRLISVLDFLEKTGGSDG